MMALLLGADSRSKHDTRVEAVRALARLPDNVREALKVCRSRVGRRALIDPGELSKHLRLGGAQGHACGQNPRRSRPCSPYFCSYFPIQHWTAL